MKAKLKKEKKKAQAKKTAPKKTEKKSTAKTKNTKTGKTVAKTASQRKTATKKAQTKKSTQKTVTKKTRSKEFPEKVPFWARLRIGGQHPSLIIDREDVVNKKTKKEEKGFVYRESTHVEKKDREEIFPNPDKSDPRPMYLKRPAKKPQRLFEPHNKELSMPDKLKKRYEKNNNK